jgi:hypothetical protein
MRIGHRLHRQLQKMAGQQFVMHDAVQAPARATKDVPKIDHIGAGRFRRGQGAVAGLAGGFVRCRQMRHLHVQAEGGHVGEALRQPCLGAVESPVHVCDGAVAAGRIVAV